MDKISDVEGIFTFGLLAKAVASVLKGPAASINTQFNGILSLKPYLRSERFYLRSAAILNSQRLWITCEFLNRDISPNFARQAAVTAPFQNQFTLLPTTYPQLYAGLSTYFPPKWFA